MLSSRQCLDSRCGMGRRSGSRPNDKTRGEKRVFVSIMYNPLSGKLLNLWLMLMMKWTDGAALPVNRWFVRGPLIKLCDWVTVILDDMSTKTLNRWGDQYATWGKLPSDIWKR